LFSLKITLSSGAKSLGLLISTTFIVSSSAVMVFIRLFTADKPEYDNDDGKHAGNPYSRQAKRNNAARAEGYPYKVY
jgi:hypothetical protein